jgi:hypothetical protein
MNAFRRRDRRPRGFRERRARIIIEDDGVGLEHLAHLSERFYGSIRRVSARREALASAWPSAAPSPGRAEAGLISKENSIEGEFAR